VTTVGVGVGVNEGTAVGVAVEAGVGVWEGSRVGVEVEVEVAEAGSGVELLSFTSGEDAGVEIDPDDATAQAVK
jgi:hypothetical protein